MKKAKFAEVQTTKRSWPSPQDYNEALQNPAINLADPLLKVGTPGLNKLGLPKAITGAFASVYYLDCPQQDFAVRCFLHNIADQRERYAKISEYLNQLNLPIMADFDYLDKGVLTQSQWYPILKMDWVDGQNLIEYIGRNIDNASILEKLRQWLRQARKTLADNGIAHGDLQHGNVLVTNDAIKLVDYDGMFVPALAGLPSNELGHRNYQHPGRTKTDFGPYLDNFSAWLIDSCLYILQRDPRLWLTLRAGEDCLLFREKDLQDPYSSFAFHELESHSNNEIRERTKFLRWLLTLRVDQIPDINSDVQMPTDLAALDPEKKKPDWLSSSKALLADEVEPVSYLQELPLEQPTRQYPYAAKWWLRHAANPVNQTRKPGAPVSNSMNIPTYYNQGRSNVAWAGLLGYLIFMLIVAIIVVINMVDTQDVRTNVTPPTAQETVENKIHRFFDAGTHFYNKHDYKSALANYQKALSYLESSGKSHTVAAANCNYWIGRMQVELKSYDQAFKSLGEAESYYKDVGLQTDVARVYYTYGQAYLRQKNYFAAIPMFETAKYEFEQQPQSVFNDQCINDLDYHLGWAYAGNKRDKEATQAFKKVTDCYYKTSGKQADYVVPRLCDMARYFSQHSLKSYAKRCMTIVRQQVILSGSQADKALVDSTAKKLGL